MPAYTIRFANDSVSDQDWMISTGHNFTLRPTRRRRAHVDIHNDHNYGIAVSTEGGISASNLSYTAATDTWDLASHTPNEWAFQSVAGTLTVRCFLNNLQPNVVPLVHEDADAASED